MAVQGKTAGLERKARTVVAIIMAARAAMREHEGWAEPDMRMMMPGGQGDGREDGRDEDGFAARGEAVGQEGPGRGDESGEWRRWRCEWRFACGGEGEDFGVGGVIERVCGPGGCGD